MSTRSQNSAQPAGSVLAALASIHPFLLLMLVSAALMMIPALNALQGGLFAVARAFFYSGIVIAVLSTTVILSVFGRPDSRLGKNQLLSLLLVFVGLPVFLALPIIQAIPTLTPLQAYYEMLSCLTTTGATLFDPAGAVPGPIHLWRGLVGWLGGFVFLVSALAVLEPLKLGGFELQSTLGTGSAAQRLLRAGAVQPNERVLKFAAILIIPYTVLTGLLLVGLAMAGEPGLVATIHAMSVLATSGISPLSDLAETASGYVGEILIFVFLFAAVTQKSMTAAFQREIRAGQGIDAEVKIALIAVTSVPLILFLRHYSGALDIEEQQNLTAALRAVWGSVFTTLSYLTTTGFESVDWQASRDWSGLDTPGLVLLALCFMGGGIATTAGGVKLLRVYALYKHGVREMSRLVHPNSVGGAGMTARRIRREGAAIAWMFLMLFLIGISTTFLALTLAGQDFDAALALAVSSLTNTGPAAFALDSTFRLVDLSAATHAILCAAMIFGRLEALVIIALFNPDFWRS